MSSYIGTEEPEVAKGTGATEEGGSARLCLVRAKPEAVPVPGPFDPGPILE